jgi:hypothetical protein
LHVICNEKPRPDQTQKPFKLKLVAVEYPQCFDRKIRESFKVLSSSRYGYVDGIGWYLGKV